MTDTPLNPPVGASVWELELFNHLTSHVESEREILEAYARVAEGTDSKAFAYLVDLLIDDERRHHQLFEALAASLKSEAELSSEDPEVPRMDFEQADREKVTALSQELLRCEKNDARELKRLHEELSDVKDTTLWDLLVGLMRRDTDKHIAILEFVLEHTPPPPR